MGARRPPRRSPMVRPDRRRPEIRSDGRGTFRPEDKAPRGIFGALGSVAVGAAEAARGGRRRPPGVPVRKDTPEREINSRGLRDQKFAEFLNMMNKRREIRRGRTGGRKRFGRGVRRR